MRKILDYWTVRNSRGSSEGYILRMVRCGKPSCKGNKWHGPYLYRRRHEYAGGKLEMVERYVGRPGSSAYQEAILDHAGVHQVPKDMQARSEDL